MKKYVCASKTLPPDLVPLFLQWPGLWDGWTGSNWDAVLTVGHLPTASSSLCWCPFDPSASQDGRTEMMRRRKGTGWPLDDVSPAGVPFYRVRAVPLTMLQWQPLGFIWCCCNDPKCFIWGVIVARCASWLVRWSCKTGLKIFPTPSSFQWLLLWLKYVAERMGMCLRTCDALLRPAGLAGEIPKALQTPAVFSVLASALGSAAHLATAFPVDMQKGFPGNLLISFSLYKKAPSNPRLPIAHNLQSNLFTFFPHLFPLHAHLFCLLNLIKWVTQY